jgi:hypothetical protein
VLSTGHHGRAVIPKRVGHGIAAGQCAWCWWLDLGEEGGINRHILNCPDGPSDAEVVPFEQLTELAVGVLPRSAELNDCDLFLDPPWRLRLAPSRRPAGALNWSKTRYDLLLTTARLRHLAVWERCAGLNVSLDQALRDDVPSMFRQSPEDRGKCPSPTMGSMRGQAYDRERES